MLVVDASAIVELILETSTGESVARRLSEAGRLVAPAHHDAEVSSAVRRATLGDRISGRDAGIALEMFVALPIERAPLAPLLDRSLELRNTVSAGDALYVALAEALRVPILSTDVRLGRSHGHDAVVELVT